MRVLLAAGGSGGHIFPSIALASELKKSGVKDIYFVSSKRQLDRRILGKTKYDCFFLSVNPMPLNFNPVRIIAFISKLFIDAAMSLYIILKVRPDVVVGFGGYSAGAIVAISKVFKVPILIHEQNFLPGRANIFLSRIADRIAVSFEDSNKYFPRAGRRIIYSGNPLRLDMLSNNRIESAGRLGLSPEKLTILIMGGSQGAAFLNRTISEVARIIKEEKGDTIQFVHLTGENDYERIKRFYEKNRITGKVFSFLERVDDAYAAADLAISRSGAAAIFELAFYGKPMMLVPYPYHKNNQRFNAMYFSRVGAAIYKEENELSQDNLAKEVLGILMDSKRREQLSEAAKKLSVPEAGRILAEEVVKLGVRD